MKSPERKNNADGYSENNEWNMKEEVEDESGEKMKHSENVNALNENLSSTMNFILKSNKSPVRTFSTDSSNPLPS